MSRAGNRKKIKVLRAKTKGKSTKSEIGLGRNPRGGTGDTKTDNVVTVVGSVPEATGSLAAGPRTTAQHSVIFLSPFFQGVPTEGELS